MASTMTIEAIAYADISAGEELHLSCKYPHPHPNRENTHRLDLPLNLLSQDRKSWIQKWHFNCTCSLCSSPEATQQSDRNKARIQGVLDELKAAGRNADTVERLSGELMTLLETEGLQAQTGNFASILAGVWLNMYNLSMAREYAALAAEKQIYYMGFDSDKARAAVEMREMLESVELV